MRPSGDIERFEGLVGEVQDVPDIQVAVVRGSSEEHVGHLDMVGSRTHRRDDAALGPFGVAHLDEPAEPEFERGQISRPGRERTYEEARRLSGRVARDGRKPVVEGARAVLGSQVRQEVDHAGVHGQALAPPRPPIACAEVQPGAERFVGIFPVAQQPDRRFGQNQRDVAL